MVSRPTHLNAYEFVIMASLRAKQLIAGCPPRVASEHHRATVVAQQEVAGGFVARLIEEPVAVPTPSGSAR